MAEQLAIFDADNHLYESPDVITQYLPSRFARDVQFVQVRERTRLLVKGHLTEYMPNPTFERVAAPGAHEAFYRGDNPDGLTLRQMSGKAIDCLPGFRNPTDRLEILDDLGLHRALMFPTLANLLEYTCEGDPDLTHAAVHAVNEWMKDTWSFNFKDRIFVVPVITLPIVEEAIKELEWVLSHGAKAILVRPGPVTGLRGSRSFALPEFDPFWARVQESGVPVCLHSSFPPLTHYYELWEPGRSDNAFASTPLHAMLTRHREIEDALSAFLCQGTLSRFPDLRILSVENGSSWVGSLLHELDSVYRKMPNMFTEHPVEAFRRSVYVNPFWEDDVISLMGHVGVDHVLFGSDYPHPEGLGNPLDYVDFLTKSQVSNSDQRLILNDNANRLLGLAAG